ncbi:glycoside hydrolase family 13 protein [Frateuria aurantia]
MAQIQPAVSPDWWRSAVIYQIYPRSFADSDGDGIGDLPGIRAKLPALRELGVDAIWLSPFFTSPQRDAGYDVADYCAVDPRFGTLEDFDQLLSSAHALGLRVIVDLVPNHTSSDHPWFQAALAAPAGAEARQHYMFRAGRGPGGIQPPNNWQSVFGGAAWSRLTDGQGIPGEWYLHLFDTSQPDLNWDDPWVRQQFLDILRFWLDRGVDGFRVDVAHGLIKAEGLPDYTPPAGAASMGGTAADTADDGDDRSAPPPPPYWGQQGVHAIFRDWHRLLATYPGERVLCGEAWVEPLSRLAEWVRPDEMQQTFNFAYLGQPWSAPSVRRIIDESLQSFASVGAPSTWVLSNHDVIRHASRLALTADHPQGDGIGPRSADKPDPELGLRRARAATLLMLALPGSAYLYQGEELGLPEVIDLPDGSRQDPTWFRTQGQRYGRDGCRVPIPWEAQAPAFGFSPSGLSWLPQPAEWAGLARDVQEHQAGSTLQLYQQALKLRRQHGLGLGKLEWLPGYPGSVLALRNGAVTVFINMGSTSVTLPQSKLVLSSMPLADDLLAPDMAVWLEPTELA